MTVIIELGLGKRATLSTSSDSSRSAEQRANVSELMLHWPKYPGLLSGAVGYLRELGLAGSLSGDPVSALRSAIESGRVAVSIEGTVNRSGVAGGQPSTPPYPKANRLAASIPGAASLPAEGPIPSWAVPNDVSADALIGYVQSVVSGAGAAVADTASSFAEGTPLGDAAPIELSGDGSLTDSIQLAARNGADEAECFAQYERELDECKAYAAMTKDPYTYVACKAQAFANYNQCRGY